MTRRRRHGSLALLAGLVLVVPGCAGGGGGGGAADDTAAAGGGAVAVSPAAGVAAPPTSSLFGTPDDVDAGRVAGSLEGFEEFGTPRDAFVPVVREDAGGGSSPSEPGTGQIAPTSTPPVTTDPIVPVAPGVPVGGIPTAPVTPPAVTPTTPPATAPPPDAPTSAPPVSGFEADFDIGGEPVVARVGDAVPPDTQQFTVSAIRAGGVTLTLNGGLLPDGSDEVTIREGEGLTLVNQTTRTTYRLRLLDVRRV